MRVQMTSGVFYEGQALMPPEVHDVPEAFARSLIREGRAIPAPDEVQTADPEASHRDPVRKRVRRQ